MSLLDTGSQAHNSVTYSIITSLFFPFYFFISLLGLLGGIIERKFINKRIREPPANLAVIVTGCSTGFGYNLALSLSKKGVTVFAGVRRLEDGQRVKESSENPDLIIPVVADVTNIDQLKNAQETIYNHLKENGLKLLALVNNAGYGYYSPVETADLHQVRRMYEVNVFGVINATQIFLPLLREFKASKPLKSRVINISSGAGHVVIPPSGPYCSTKYSLEAISDALRMELSAWDIAVCLVEPGRFRTEFQEKAYIDFVNGGIGHVPPEVENHYKKLIQINNEQSASLVRPDNKLCVKVIEDSLFDTIPLARYLSGKDVQFGVPIIKFLKSEVITDRILGSKWRSLQK